MTARPFAPGARAFMVHLFTATGAVFAMLALIEAANADWAMMFLWLVVAFVVDGIDGPLARKYDVKTHAPRVDGVLLDLIIDYLTYVFIPAYALFWSGMLPGLMGWAGLIGITLASAIYFADTRMKTEDCSFNGFPGCWNMFVLVVFALNPPALVTASMVVLLGAAMFLPIKFVHPVRTERWRSLTLPVALAWTFCAGLAAWHNFDPGPLARWALILSSIYLTFAGIVQQMFPVEKAD